MFYCISAARSRLYQIGFMPQMDIRSVSWIEGWHAAFIGALAHRLMRPVLGPDGLKGDHDLVAVTIRVQGGTHLLLYGLTNGLLHGCDITRIGCSCHGLYDGRH